MLRLNFFLVIALLCVFSFGAFLAGSVSLGFAQEPAKAADDSAAKPIKLGALLSLSGVSRRQIAWKVSIAEFFIRLRAYHI